MGSRDKDLGTPHQPLLSSLVVRPTDSGGGGGAGGGAGGGSDYEPGEVRRDPPSYSRSDRLHDNHGYRMRAGSSVSPVRRRNGDSRYSPEIDHQSGGQRRTRGGFGRGRDVGRFRDFSPPYGRGRGTGRFNRGFDGPGLGPGPFRGDGVPRSHPNVRPREGDWMCPDPMCNNLNFARRDHCNNCHRPRYPPPGVSPRRGYLGPPPPSRRFQGPPLDRSPIRTNGYRSPPPRAWGAEGNIPRDYGTGGRFPDHHHHPIRRDNRPDYLEDDFRDRNRFDRPVMVDWGRDRGRDNFKEGYNRHLPSPPLPLPPPPPLHRGGGRFGRDERERSRSPARGLGPPAPMKDYRRDVYADRAKDDRPLPRRDRVSNVY